MSYNVEISLFAVLSTTNEFYWITKCSTIYKMFYLNLNCLDLNLPSLIVHLNSNIYVSSLPHIKHINGKAEMVGNLFEFSLSFCTRYTFTIAVSTTIDFLVKSYQKSISTAIRPIFIITSSSYRTTYLATAHLLRNLPPLHLFITVRSFQWLVQHSCPVKELASFCSVFKFNHSPP